MRSGELALHFAIRASTSRNCGIEAEAEFQTRPNQTKPVRVESSRVASRKGAQRLGLGRRQRREERGERREEMRNRIMIHMLCAGNASWACRSFSTGVVDRGQKERKGKERGSGTDRRRTEGE